MSGEDDLHTKVVVVFKIYDFVVQEFFIWGHFGYPNMYYNIL